MGFCEAYGGYQSTPYADGSVSGEKKVEKCPIRGREARIVVFYVGCFSERAIGTDCLLPFLLFVQSMQS